MRWRGIEREREVTTINIRRHNVTHKRRRTENKEKKTGANGWEENRAETIQCCYVRDKIERIKTRFRRVGKWRVEYFRWSEGGKAVSEQEWPYTSDKTRIHDTHTKKNNNNIMKHYGLVIRYEHNTETKTQQPAQWAYWFRWYADKTFTNVMNVIVHHRIYLHGVFHFGPSIFSCSSYHIFWLVIPVFNVLSLSLLFWFGQSLLALLLLISMLLHSHFIIKLCTKLTCPPPKWMAKKTDTWKKK